MSLQDLPPELLTEIISYLPTAKSVANLSQTNRATHDLVVKDGWRAFVTKRFPSIAVSGNYSKAARSLTSLSRSWDRRALLARYLEPFFVHSYPSRAVREQWIKPTGQTMGFQPVIDSYEDGDANAWDCKREILAWSAGAEILLRRRYLWGGRLSTQRDERWFSYKPAGSREGVDDVTALKLLSNPYRARNGVAPGTYQFIYGTASGTLAFVSLGQATARSYSSSSSAMAFETDRRTVRAADLSPGQNLLVAALGEKASLALYHIPDNPTGVKRVNPISERTVIPDGLSMRVWSTRFLDSKRLAVGLGPASRPVQIFELTPSGISPDPIHKFGLDATPWACDDRVQLPPSGGDSARPKSSSVYPIEPLGSPAKGGHGAGDVFLSGGYDGIVRLHDTRSPSPFESCYFDPTDESAIYSLLALGRERLVAGTARHNMLKVFDLRVAGGRNYWHAGSGRRPDRRLGWCLFLTDRARANWQQQQPEPARQQRRGGGAGRFDWQRGRARFGAGRESPVYSLSSPAPASAAIYAGVEYEVVQLDVVDAEHSAEIFWRDRNVLSLAMYEQFPGGAIPLRVQRPLDQMRDRPPLEGYDLLWTDSRT